MTMTRWIMISTTLYSLAATACTDVECGPGTIERNGTCEPSDETVGDATCGAHTHLESGECVPDTKPTQCDPTTTMEVKDPVTGVITCIGTGGGGCDATFACPAPSDGNHQTICGQLYNLEDDTKFQGPNPQGNACTTATTDGPCSLGIVAYDAVQFGMNPMTAPKLATDPVYIDDCGRYRVPNIAIPTMPFIGLGIDDRDSAKMGPAGTTNAVGVATATTGGMATPNLDGYAVPKATTDKWAASGGPTIATGYYVPIYRKNKFTTTLTEAKRREVQSGVTFTRQGATVPNNDFYFDSAETTRETVDTNATATGANGTALIINATVMDSLIYSGQGGGLDSTCRWEQKAGATLAGIVFVQDFRPINAIGQTCDR